MEQEIEKQDGDRNAEYDSRKSSTETWAGLLGQERYPVPMQGTNTTSKTDKRRKGPENEERLG